MVVNLCILCYLHKSLCKLFKTQIFTVSFDKVEKSKPFKCCTFGASSVRNQHLATGDFDGKLCIWYLSLPTRCSCLNAILQVYCLFNDIQ